jgi:ferritin-like metal-binding protein YciE
MSLDSLRDLYVDQLKDAYNAEKQLLKALPRMAKSATSEELRDAFREHEDVTQRQVDRLEKIFQGLQKPATGKKCKGMEGLIEEGKEMLQEKGEPSVIDAGLITAAQRVEHYEIALYGSLRTYAQVIGDEEAASLLQQTLDEEKEADEKLNRIAEELNHAADREGQESGDGSGDGRERAAAPRGRRRTRGNG